MQYENTMSPTGVHAQHAESYLRSIQTANAKLPEVVEMQEASRDQVMNALREEDVHEANPVLHLAKLGLYDPDREDVVLHPLNVENFTSVIEIGTGVYKLSREIYDRAMELLTAEPKFLYVK